MPWMYGSHDENEFRFRWGQSCHMTGLRRKYKWGLHPCLCVHARGCVCSPSWVVTLFGLCIGTDRFTCTTGQLASFGVVDKIRLINYVCTPGFVMALCFSNSIPFKQHANLELTGRVVAPVVLISDVILRFPDAHLLWWRCQCSYLFDCVRPITIWALDIRWKFNRSSPAILSDVDQVIALVSIIQ